MDVPSKFLAWQNVRMIANVQSKYECCKLLLLLVVLDRSVAFLWEVIICRDMTTPLYLKAPRFGCICPAHWTSFRIRRNTWLKTIISNNIKTRETSLVYRIVLHDDGTSTARCLFNTDPFQGEATSPSKRQTLKDWMARTFYLIKSLTPELHKHTAICWHCGLAERQMHKRTHGFMCTS